MWLGVTAYLSLSKEGKLDKLPKHGILEFFVDLRGGRPVL